jgi:hypothetical protein
VLPALLDNMLFFLRVNVRKVRPFAMPWPIEGYPEPTIDFLGAAAELPREDE